jgi:membrane protease YdiL (CAAX protease family)
LLFIAAATGAGLYLVSHGVVRWPFLGHPNPARVYAGMMVYLPVFALAWVSMGWLRWAGIPVAGQFVWPRRSLLFVICLVISFAYALYLLVRHPVDMTRVVLYPPILILSFLNAFSEEIIYRLVLYELLKRVVRAGMAANFLQSAAYALPHYYIGGIRFAAFAFAYGLVLGRIKEKGGSVVPCMVCHFVIDLGAIGAPLLLRMRMPS